MNASHKTTLTLLLGLFLVSACDEDEATLSLEVQISPAAEYQQLDIKTMDLQLQSLAGSIFSWQQAIQPFSVLPLEPLKLDVGNFSLPAGGYSAVGLFAPSSAGEVLLGGMQYDLVSPQVSELAAIDLQLGQSKSRAVLRLDLQLSVVDRRGSYGDFLLQPHLRWVSEQNAAGLSGSIPVNWLATDCDVGAMVYLFEGLNATPHDEWRGVHPSVAASSGVKHGEGGDGRFDFGRLNPGAYTLALTCQGEQERPDQNDGLSFRELHRFDLPAGADLQLYFPLTTDQR